MAVPTLDDREQQSLDTLLDRLEDAGPHAMNEDLATQITQTIFHSQPEFTDIILKEAMIYVVCRLRKAVDDMLEFASIAVKQHPTKIDAAMWRAQGECYKGITGRAGFEEGMTFDDFERDVRESLAVDAVTLRRGIVDFSALAIVAEIAAGRLAKAICVAQGDIDGLIRESDSIVRECQIMGLARLENCFIQLVPLSISADIVPSVSVLISLPPSLLFLLVPTSMTVSKLAILPCQLSNMPAPHSRLLIVSQITTKPLIPAPVEIRAVSLSRSSDASGSSAYTMAASRRGSSHSCCHTLLAGSPNNPER